MGEASFSIVVVVGISKLDIRTKIQLRSFNATAFAPTATLGIRLTVPPWIDALHA